MWEIISLSLKWYNYENTWKKLQLKPLQNEDPTPNVSVPPVALANENN